jgi:rSAM/selenodomain-associated transferase 2
MQLRIAVVIPAINEQARISDAVQSAIRGGAEEVIVADGGSTDDTATMARSAGARVISSRLGRGVQMNAGASESTAEVLLFLHADNRLPKDFARQIQSAVAVPRIQAGVFRQKIEGASPMFRLLAWGNEQRVQWKNLAYGDQGIWVRRRIFEELGRFPEVPLMEDYIFSERLRQQHRFVILPGPLILSSRRWHRRGIVGQTLLNWRIIAAYKQGKSLDELSSLYRRHDK